MVARVDRPMTVEEWRALERGSHQTRHEYIDGWVYAMAGEALTTRRLALMQSNRSKPRWEVVRAGPTHLTRPCASQPAAIPTQTPR